MRVRDRDAAASIHAGCCGDNVEKLQEFVFIETFALPTTAPSTAAAKDHGHRHQKNRPGGGFFDGATTGSDIGYVQPVHRHVDRDVPPLGQIRRDVAQTAGGPGRRIEMPHHGLATRWHRKTYGLPALDIDPAHLRRDHHFTCHLTRIAPRAQIDARRRSRNPYSATLPSRVMTSVLLRTICSGNTTVIAWVGQMV